MTIQLQRGLPAAVTSQMAIHHLRELNYEKCGLGKLPTATTFAMKSVSPMDQLLAFSQVVKWLLQQIGGTLNQFSEFDEPNAVSLEIIQACKQFINMENVAPHEIRTGSGDVVCQILLAICEAVIQKHHVQKATWRDDDQQQRQGEQEDNEDQDDQNDDAFDDGLMNTFAVGIGKQQAFAAQQIAPGVNDVHIWQEECNAVEPQLAASKYSLNADWRPDITKLSTLNNNLSQSTGLINQQLQVVSDQLEKQIERLQQREQFLNQQISQFSGKLIEESRKHQALQSEADEIVKDIELLTEQLQETTEKCKVAKNEMNYESGRINDSSAVSYAKQAIAQLSSEIRDIDLKIVLAQQRLFQFEQK